jgi:hypothetical protein
MAPDRTPTSTNPTKIVRTRERSDSWIRRKHVGRLMARTRVWHLAELA